MVKIFNYEEFLNEGEFFSSWDIGDDVSFEPMYKQQQEHGIDAEPREGRITAVRFTAPKVWYDIVDEYTGLLFQNIDSGKIRRSIWYVDPKDKIKESPQPEK